VSVKCPNCQAENPERKKFCGECGAPLGSGFKARDAEDGFPSRGIVGSITRTLETPIEGIAAGSLFADRYQIVEELGEGGMGRVYKVIDTEIDARIALKLIKAEVAADQKTIERFRNELKTAREISHKNVCRMYHLGKQETSYYITMEFVEGEDLKGTIKRVGQVGVGKTIEIAKQICEGLSEAHRVGVVHRDLKPNNIMIDKDGNAKIMDFGIARSVKAEGLTGAGEMIGTPEYMSPEQAEAKEVDSRSDIYSMGVVLFEMLTGRPPFEGDTPLALAMKQKNEMPVDPGKLNPQIPTDLSRLILRCLEKDRQARYQSTDEVFKDLIEIEEGLRASTEKAASVRPVSIREITVSFPLKKVLWPVLFIAAAVAAGLLIWKPWSAKRPPSTPSEAPFVAVLPFKDISPQRDNAYLCDGMTEQIISNLTKIPGIKVIARTSVMQYRDTQKDVRQISQELGVNYILEGNIRKSEEQLRVSASLIQTAEGTVMWSNDYDTDWKDIIAIQDDVSRSIAGALKVELTDRTANTIRASSPADAEAYDYYLRARHYVMNTYVLTKKEEDFQHAVSLANKAVELDPNSFYGYRGLAFLYESHWLVTDNEKDLAEELKYIEKAYALNPEVSETNAAMGLMRVRERKYDEAFSFLKTAMEINPNAFDTLHLTGMFYQYLGLFYRSIEFYSRALEFDPLNYYTLMNRGGSWILIGEFDRALKDLQKSDQIMPENTYNLDTYALALVMKKDYEKAGEILERIESLPRGYSFYFNLTKALYLAGRGERDKAMETEKYGIVLAFLGMKDEALEAIEAGIKENTQLSLAFYSYLPLTKLDIYESLRGDPRFQDIVKKEKQEYEEKRERYTLSSRFEEQ
jgi:serine/threonine protein kinase